MGSVVELGVPPLEKRSSWYCTPLKVVAAPPELIAITSAGWPEPLLDELLEELLELEELLLELEVLLLELVELLELEVLLELELVLELVLDELLLDEGSPPPQAINADDSNSGAAQRPQCAMGLVLMTCVS